MNYKVRLLWCGERVVMATGRPAPPSGKPDSKELHEKPREEAEPQQQVPSQEGQWPSMPESDDFGDIYEYFRKYFG